MIQCRRELRKRELRASRVTLRLIKRENISRDSWLLATATVFDEIAQAKVARSDLLIICVRNDRAYLEIFWIIIIIITLGIQLNLINDVFFYECIDRDTA